MFKSIQALRGIAAFLVLLMHCEAVFVLRFGSFPFGRMFDGGEMGVDIFFVISGFVLYHAHNEDFGRPEKLTRYIRRRFWRIFPVYWIVSIAVLITKLSTGWHFPLTGFEIVSSLLLLPTQVYALNILEVAWTLRFEILFYLLLGILIANLRLGLVISAIVFISCPILFVAMGPVPGWPQPKLVIADPRLIEFLFGITAAWLIKGKLPVLIDRWSLAIFAVGVAMLAFGMAWESTTPIEIAPQYIKFTFSEVSRVCTAGIGSFFLITGLAALEKTGKLKAPNLLEYLGSSSYSLYLIHLPLITVMATLWRHFHMESHVPNAVTFLVFVLVSVVIAFVFYELVERKIIKLTQKSDKGLFPTAREKLLGDKS